MTSMLVRGSFVHCPKLGEVEILRDWLAAVNDSGYITHFESAQSAASSDLLHLHGHGQSPNSSPSTPLRTIPLGSFLLPPFNDLHLHAPQFLYQGTGLDLPLLQWLHQYAFKAESSLDSNPSLARKVYRQLGYRLVEAGSGSVCLFGTLKAETNLILVEEMRRAGIRAFVGKVSMDISSRPDYVEASAEHAVAAARKFGDQLALSPSTTPSLVHPVITPRFVPTCSDALLHALGELAEEKGWRIQSHMAESSDQVEYVKRERGEEDMRVFERAGLLTSRTIQAHCTFLESSRSSSSDPHPNYNSFTHLANLGTAIAHCPLSNIYFSASNAFALREALDAHVKVGLGTDVAGGYSLDIMSAMRTAVAVSRIREGKRQKESSIDMNNETNAKTLAIDWKESLFLATLGGAHALGIESGVFGVGRPFDAQQICLFDSNTQVGVGALDFFELETELERDKASNHKGNHLSDEMIEKWWCIGDERNRIRMWVQGVICTK